MLRAIIFDLDGVLLESTEVKTGAFRRLFADRAEHVEEIVAYHEAHAGVPRFEKFRLIFREILRQPLSDEEFQSLCDRYAALCLDGVLTVPLVAGAEAFLRDHHRAVPLFVASGTPEGELHEILERRGLTKYFHGMFGSPASKAEIVGRILADWALQPEATLFIGDSDMDWDAARAYAVPFVGRIHRGSPKGWGGEPPPVTIRDLTELSVLLECGLTSDLASGEGIR